MKNIKFWLVSTTLWIQVWEQNVFTAHTSYSKFNCVYGLATWLENRGRHLSCCPCIYRSILVGPFCCESFLQSRPRHRFLLITFAILLRLTSNHLQTLAFDAFYRFAPSDSPNDQPEPIYPQKTGLRTRPQPLVPRRAKSGNTRSRNTQGKPPWEVVSTDYLSSDKEEKYTIWRIRLGTQQKGQKGDTLLDCYWINTAKSW